MKKLLTAFFVCYTFYTILALTSCQPAGTESKSVDILTTLNEKGFSTLGTILIGLLLISGIILFFVGAGAITKRVLDLSSLEDGIWTFIGILFVCSLVGVVSYGVGVLIVLFL